MDNPPEARIPERLQTERLTLTLFSRSNPAHYACALSGLNNPIAHARMGDYGIRTAAQLDALHNSTLLRYPFRYNREVFYLIQLRDLPDSPLMGGVTLGQRSKNIPPDIGWCMASEEFMGKGYATEAARELLRSLREDVGIRDICTWPDAANRESNRVAKKLGFVEGGTVKVKDMGGKETTIWILEGMDRIQKGLEINFNGEEID